MSKKIKQRRVHILSAGEARRFQEGKPVFCGQHRHASIDEARLMVNGTRRPGIQSAGAPEPDSYEHSFEGIASWAKRPDGTDAVDEYLELVRCRVLQIVGTTVQLVPGAPVAGGVNSRGISLRDQWRKRLWMRKPRGFIGKNTMANTSTGGANAANNSQ